MAIAAEDARWGRGLGASASGHLTPNATSMSPRKSHFRMTDELLEVLARILRERGGTNARGVPYTVQIYGERGGVDAHAVQNACLDFDIEVGPALLRKLAAHGVDRAAFAARVRARCAELAAGAAGCGLILAYAERPRPKEALACAQCPRQALRAAGASEELAVALAYVPAHNLRGVDADEIEAVGAPPEAAAALAARLASVPETPTVLRKADEYTMAADLFGPDVDVEAECRLECPVCGAVYDDDGEWVPRLAEADAPGGSAIPLRTDRVGFHAYAVANPEAYAERLAAASEGRDDWEAQGEAARPKATTTPELAAIENRARVALEEAGLVARARTGGRWWACDDREAAAAECFLAEVAEHHLDMRASAMRAEAAVGLRVPYTWKPRMKGRGRSAEPVGLDRGTRYDRLAVFAATGKPLGPGRPIASLPDAAAFLTLVLRAATPALPAEVVEETRRARGEGLLQPASPPRTGAKKKRRSKVGGAGGSGSGTAAQGSMAPARDAWEPVAARCEAATYARALKLSTGLLHKACAVVSHAGRPLAPIVRGSTAADACCQPAGWERWPAHWPHLRFDSLSERAAAAGGGRLLSGRVSFGGRHLCPIARREHNSNGGFVLVTVTKRGAVRFSFRCYSADCAKKGVDLGSCEALPRELELCLLRGGGITVGGPPPRKRAKAKATASTTATATASARPSGPAPLPLPRRTTLLPPHREEAGKKTTVAACPTPLPEGLFGTKGPTRGDADPFGALKSAWGCR